MVGAALEGIKVADFAWAVVGPMAVRYLADHGATVVHVETTRTLDPIRRSPPYKDNIPGQERALLFSMSNINKYGMALDLDIPQAVEVSKRLVAWADIVIESSSGRRLESIGLGYKDLANMKPGIIMVSISAQGSGGPHSHVPGYGSLLTSFFGFAEITGLAIQIPQEVYGAYVDHVTPRLVAAGIVAALEYRRRTGKGQYLEASLFEGSLHLLSPIFLDYVVNKRVASRRGNQCSWAAPHGAYRCQGDDQWCAIAVTSDSEWRSLCQVIGEPQWTKNSEFATVLGRKKREAFLDEKLEEWTKCHTPEEVMTLLQRAGVPTGVVRDPKGICEDPQLKHLSHFWVEEHAVIGRHSVENSPFKLSETPAELQRPAPLLGQDTEYVCTQLLGMSSEEFVDLFSKGVFE